MFNANQIMSGYVINLADVSYYGCYPMSFEELRYEFEVLPMYDDELEGLLEI
ncbi:MULTISPECIES: hypothetical protein [Agrobacterium]|uniref:hypothetical protein n=1 Tax=Agrobacterium TaxID=357 RepID=UPI0009C8FA73|nr:MULTISPECIES: hypothetical protein [Agrobacterium]CUX21772.1 conserved hypothetical protein [Agrobacterium sp. NCPPB 925]